MKRRAVFFTIFLLFASMPCGCDLAVSSQPQAVVTISEEDQEIPKHSTPSTSSPSTKVLSKSKTRPYKAKLLTPRADGLITYGNELATIDASHTSDGYIMVLYHGTNSKVKLQVTGPDQITYTYDLTGSDYDVFPLTSGSGAYTVTVYEHLSDTQYTTAYSTVITAALKNPNRPFLYPNQYVNYTNAQLAIRQSEKLAKGADNDLEVVSNIYHYMISNIKYDSEKASSLQSGYLTDIDEVLSSQRGVCLDYAAVMTSMLRLQGIPSRLEIGYAKDTYHAWVRVKLKDKGTIDDAIVFDGSDWTLLDPTFAASDSSEQTMHFITDPKNYETKFTY